jgi:hypothetical protein
MISSEMQQNLSERQNFSLNIQSIMSNERNDCYPGLFEPKLSMILCIIVSCILIPINIFTYYGIIWYERYGTDNHRTLMNKLLSSVCWNVIVSNLVIVSDVIRYIVGPFSLHFCFIQVLIKVMMKTMLLLYMDAIILVRYILIFWLKNPASVNNEFWSRFLNLWIPGFCFLLDSVRYFLPGKQSFSYYTCAGIDSSSGFHCISLF